MPLQAGKALWPRFYCTVKRAFIGIPYPFRVESELVLICVVLQDAGEGRVGRRGKGEAEREREKSCYTLSFIDHYGSRVHLAQLSGEQRWSCRAGLLLQRSSHSAALLQSLGLKQLRHQKCHISYDNMICYISGAAD